MAKYSSNIPWKIPKDTPEQRGETWTFWGIYDRLALPQVPHSGASRGGGDLHGGRALQRRGVLHEAGQLQKGAWKLGPGCPGDVADPNLPRFGRYPAW